ncbi:DUF262 domain-containing protein [Proteus faecis]|uniref:DUF262 domain-containing protein n=1 Tax=Proteus faecis TaxID=2050967 RepID=UPI0020BFF98A
MSRGQNQQEYVTKTEQEQESLDLDIRRMEKITDHEIREFPISVIVDKYQIGLEEDKAEIFIPDYQREFIWSKKHQSRFIESLLLNLPIPYLFVADLSQGENEGRIEIVDGSQRIRTLHSFLNNKLMLEGLKKLPTANGFIFSDFSHARRLRFARKTIRMIELTEYCDEETRREIFDRLNSGGISLTNMEQRQGSNDGPLLDVIINMSNLEIFHQICPITEARKNRAEYPELVLRYLAYSNNYLEFEKSVDTFLTSYLTEGNSNFNSDIDREIRKQFHDMCEFVNTHFPYGFRKNPTATTVPRIRFEALSVGVTLALRENPSLIPRDISAWIDSPEFIKHTRSDASNSRPRVRGRIEYVRDMLLGITHTSEIDDSEE